MLQDEEIDPQGWRLSSCVTRGEIDCRVQNRITGKIWLINRRFPIELNLKGNALRDLAGCLLSFENPNPEPEDEDGLSPIQMGRTGNITASRKVSLCNVPPEAIEEMQRRGEPINRQTANALYLEWFSNANGRVVVESTSFLFFISVFSWRMSAEEGEIQKEKNRETAKRWLDMVAEENDEEYADDDNDFEDDWQMDEFDWERQLQESDAMTERYMTLIEEFLDHPERDQIIAHEMGWNSLEDAMADEGEESPFFEEELFFEEEDFFEDDIHPLDPITENEGRDWVRGRDGRIRHPLTERATVLATAIWRCCKESRLTGNMEDPDVHNLIFHTQTFNAKLAGALDGLAYDDEPDGGFIVACLKRALKHFGVAINATSSVAQKNLLPQASLQAFRDEFFAIRQQILDLMHHYRQIN